MRIDFEQGLYELCARRIEQDDSFCKDNGISVKDFPVEVDEDLFQKYRAHLLKRTLQNVYNNSSEYRRKFDECGIKPDDICGLEDINKLPFTMPDELQGEGSGFLCISQRYVEKPVTYFSSGTTGIKKRIMFSHNDVEHILDYIGMAMHSLTDNQDARVLSLMVNSMGRGASYVFCRSIERVGMQGFPADMEAESSEIIQLSLENKCNVWFGDVLTIYRIAKETERTFDLKKLGLRLIYITMANVPAAIMQYFENAFGCEVMTHYGLTEAGWGFAPDNIGCDGYVYNELDVIAEIIDPKTAMPVSKGESGEITLTIIGRDAMPLIRYRTGDISAFLEPMYGRRPVLKHIERRLEGCFSNNGSVIWPAMVEDVLYSFPSIIDYRPFYDKTGRVLIEIETVWSEDELSREYVDLKTALEEALVDIDAIRLATDGIELELFPIGGLKKYCYEKKRFIEISDIDNRLLRD